MSFENRHHLNAHASPDKEYIQLPSHAEQFVMQALYQAAKGDVQAWHENLQLADWFNGYKEPIE